MSELPDIFALHLWDARAQAEALLRCLTKIHRWYEELPLLTETERASRGKDIRREIADMLSANASIRGALEQAADELAPKA